MCIHLVVNPETIEESASCNDFFMLDFSLTWKNSLEKEMGSCPVFNLNSEPEKIFSNPSAVIFTASCGDISSAVMTKTLEYAKSGGVVVLEIPSSDWKRHDIGIAPSDESKDDNAGIFFSFKNTKIDPIAQPWIGAIEEMPLMAVVYDSGHLHADAEVMLYAGEKPAIVKMPMGKGWIIVLLFDFAMQITSVRQGIPSGEAFRVKKRLGRIPLIIETEDLVAEPFMLDNSAPYADILEKFLFNIIEELTPLPRLWYFPYQYDGVFLMSHDDEKRGKAKSMYMVEEESAKGFTSTFFATCPPGAGRRWENAKRDILDRGFDIQWHWNRFPDNFWIIPSGEQVKNFKEISGIPPTSCRLHFLNWGIDYDEPFKIMEENGVVIDSSYGPNRGKGYIFGTGMPFHPVKKNGELYNLYEIPFQTQENWGGVNIAYFEKLLKESGEAYHSVIVSLFHPHKIASGFGKKMWLGSFETAKKYNHWITTFSQFADFYIQRSKTIISRSFGNRIEGRGVFSVESSGDFANSDMAVRIYTGENGIDKDEEGIKFRLKGSGGSRIISLDGLTSGNSRMISDLGREYILVRI
jgi:hypothetical protein